MGDWAKRAFAAIAASARWLPASCGKSTCVAVQDETYAERFRVLGARPEAVHVTGSMKYDGAQTDRNNATTRRLAALAGFSNDDIVLLAGSTQEPEEAMALETFRTLSQQWPQLRLVLVPRHPDRFEAVARLLDASGIPWQRRTTIEGREEWGEGRGNCDSASTLPSPLSPLPSSAPRVLLVDVVGELGAWWGTAQFAFVGGSMGSRGGQNMIEPAAYGAAISFGPNTWNFRDIVAAMLDHKAAVVVADAEEFTQFVRRCLAEPAYAAELGGRAQKLVQSQLGATERTLDLLARQNLASVENDTDQCHVGSAGRTSSMRPNSCSTTASKSIESTAPGSIVPEGSTESGRGIAAF